MRTSIVAGLIATALLGTIVISYAQVSSGSPEATQQNLAKKPTDNNVQNDQQNAAGNRLHQTPKSGQ
jgi:hypothetical protein